VRAGHQIATTSRFDRENLTFHPFQWAAASFVDTGLSFLSFLELYRTDVAERRVTTRRVVEPLDVVEHVGAGLHVLPELETAALEIYLVHGRRIGPSARLLRDFLLAAMQENG
jgi:hypothetical protein